LKYWQDNQIFQKTLDRTSTEGDFIFYDGPPFATGLPHYGHIIASAIKDVIPRYKTMCGYQVARRWGWDCHGLPVENLIEQELKLKTKKDIETLGIGEFNQACQASVLRYANEWQKFIPRMGRWVNMENDYETMSDKYIEMIWWIFKELHTQGLIYEGYKSMHLCPRCETTLSNFEVTLGYQDVEDISVYVKFSIFNFQFSNKVKIQNPKAEVYFLAWTTTPWTLPGNMALAVGDSIKYQVLSIKDQYYIVAAARVKEVMKNQEFEVVGEVNGSELVGLEYAPLFDFTAEQVKKDSNAKSAFKVYAADFVSTEEGTGIVHVAPAFGEDDYNLSLKYQIPFVQHVNSDGTFKDYVSNWAGRSVKPKKDPSETDREIIKYLEEHSLLFSTEKVRHSYPFCWRCDSPLINYASSSWFVRVIDLKERLLAANAKINWVPEHLRDGRFGKWLEGARDWAISRSRYWGAPLPVWRCQNPACNELKVVGSVKEIVELSLRVTNRSEAISNSNVEIASVATLPRNDTTMDLHRPYIDQVKFKCNKCDGEMQRVPEVFDCWFESGAMPYASEYLFSDYELSAKTTREELRSHIAFPADFIAEGIDQTRGWFYTLLVLGVALYDESPFKNVVVNGIILAENGQKMSKRLKNYPDPQKVIDQYGADAMRFYLLSSGAVRGESLNFSEKGVDEVYKKVVLLTLNVLKFWQTYSDKISNFQFLISKLQGRSILDRWIIWCLASAINEVTDSLEKYEIDRACRTIVWLIDDLVSTWYVRRSRDRFKNEGQDKESAIMTLQFVLQELSKLLAPIAPFLAEYLYRESGGKKESVHLENWGQGKWVQEITESDDYKLDKQMEQVRQICEIGHRLRDETQVKVRQSLRRCQILKSKYQINAEGQILNGIIELIVDELNVKEVGIVETLPSGEGWISKDGVALYTIIDQELKAEGLVRELTRQINNLRKKQGLTIQDKVTVEYQTVEDALKQMIIKSKQELAKAVLASDFVEEENVEGAEIKVDGLLIIINLLKN